MKSKFLTFILSFIPGLGHIYLGLLQRGLVFLLMTVFVIIGGIFFGVLQIFYDPIPFILLPFIWLAALVDALVLADRINRQVAEDRTKGVDENSSRKALEEEMKRQNNKILALAFSIMPGAGHMYIAQIEKGIQIMVAFFLTLYLSDFLNITLFLIFAPILWFYSVFDVLHIVSNNDNYQKTTFLGNYFRDNYFPGKTGKYIGIGLIVIGCIMILDKIVVPQLSIFLGPQLLDYLRTGLIALLFIAGGIKLMLGSKAKGETKS